MGTDQIDLLCGHCNHTFATFLHELAEKNAKVVCPNCGENHDGKGAKAEGTVPQKADSAFKGSTMAGSTGSTKGASIIRERKQNKKQPS